ncbi:hypothetical protein CEXT_615051 [Caerostris extrusa]|uniref:Uncharacterized protein n=1 Tax=Caerostris extrusa TaxID=172846 RepID=A0AAV4XE04_CAEEX|nr:hypothetical protein CEXT_615051 [Caerostris extrusa]
MEARQEKESESRERIKKRNRGQSRRKSQIFQQGDRSTMPTHHGKPVYIGHHLTIPVVLLSITQHAQSVVPRDHVH